MTPRADNWGLDLSLNLKFFEPPLLSDSGLKLQLTLLVNKVIAVFCYADYIHHKVKFDHPRWFSGPLGLFFLTHQWLFFFTKYF